MALLLALSLDAAPATAGATGKSVVVRVLARTDLDAAGVKPALDLDYGSFRWLELDSSDLARLAARGVPYVVVQDARQVRVPGFRFDPLVEGEPDIPPALRADPSRPGFRLLQLAGPPRDAWISRLQGAGARILQYYPHNTYLVWAGPVPSEAFNRLDFIRWQGLFHPAYKINADLENRIGTISNVDVTFFDDGKREATLDALSRLGAKILQVYPSQPDRAFYDAILRLDAGAVEAVANLDTVLWMGFASPRPVLDDEMSDQIVAGNHPGGIPVTGYASHLANLGVDGSGVTWAVVDTGVDYDHPDLGSHIVGGYSFPGIPAGCDPGTTPGADCTSGGHGTHVAGIIGGDATGGFTDANGFLYGLGVAPEYGIFAMNSLSGPVWPPTGGYQEHSKRAVLGGAIGGNNSWNTGEGEAHGYQSSERTHDLMVRDGNFDTTNVAEPFIEVFSAGNSGPFSYSLTPPHEAKNLIATASTMNYRIGSIDSVSDFSSRGPAVDGRWVPTIAAPGEQIASSRNDVGGFCASPIAGTNDLYAFCSGTSMASPHAAGAVILLTDWWRGFNAGANPSPAMAKALLVNGAADMGAADIPNIDEGWGRINITNVVNPPAPAAYWDQTTLLAATGQEVHLTLGVPNPSLPVKVTLAWTDAAGALGADPALVNDLDLTVVDGASTYLGNHFSAGWSSPGGTPDTLNNLENVFIQHPGGTTIDITIAAAAVNGDGVPYNGDLTDQDFALVCSNCALSPDFTLAASPATLAVCAPADASYTVSIGSILGFADPVTLSASGNPPGTTVGFGSNPVTPAGSSTLTVSNTGSASAGSYTLQIDAASTTGTKSRTAGLNLFTAVPSAITLLTPVAGATDQPVKPTFTWQAASAGGTYTLQVASDAAFANIVETASGLTATTYTLAGTLNTGTTYYWRVQAGNVCGTGAFSAARSFTTLLAPGQCAAGKTATQLLTANFDSGFTGWTHSGSNDSWGLSSMRVHSGASSMHADDPGFVSDQLLVSPAVPLPSGGLPLFLKFWNYQSIEGFTGGCYDGAVVAISIDNGSTWARLEPQLLTDPYDGPVATSYGNPIGGTNAWCGNPQDWTLSVVDLSAFAGQTVRFRFRLGSDIVVSEEGWYIDDLTVQACRTRLFADGFDNGNLSGWSWYIPH